MRNTYIAVTVTEYGKNIAYVLTVSNNDNIVSALKIKGLIFGNICATKKKAKELVDLWNESYKNNGTYMFYYKGGNTMKRISETKLHLFKFTDDEKTIKGIKDWEFVEIQDKNGNKLTEKVFSESTFLYRDKTKSEFYNKAVL